MSHFTVLVTNTQERDVDTQLAPFDENRLMPRHISKTKADLIEAGRKDVARAQRKVAEYDADPEAYRASTSNSTHLDWINGEAREIAKVTDQEELFKIGAKWYEDDLDEDGNYWSESNEDAKWDWYEVGGRWAGFFTSKEDGEKTDVVKVKDIDWNAMEEAEKIRRAEYFDEQMALKKDQRFMWADNRDEILKMTKEEYVNRPVTHSTFAVLHNGRWYERGNMGWWGIVSDGKEQDEWDEEWSKLVQGLDPETEVTIVDCHI